MFQPKRKLASRTLNMSGKQICVTYFLVYNCLSHVYKVNHKKSSLKTCKSEHQNKIIKIYKVC